MVLKLKNKKCYVAVAMINGMALRYGHLCESELKYAQLSGSC